MNAGEVEQDIRDHIQIGALRSGRAGGGSRPRRGAPQTRPPRRMGPRRGNAPVSPAPRGMAAGVPGVRDPGRTAALWRSRKLSMAYLSLAVLCLAGWWAMIVGDEEGVFAAGIVSLTAFILSLGLAVAAGSGTTGQPRRNGCSIRHSCCFTFRWRSESWWSSPRLPASRCMRRASFPIGRFSSSRIRSGSKLWTSWIAHHESKGEPVPEKLREDRVRAGPTTKARSGRPGSTVGR